MGGGKAVRDSGLVVCGEVFERLTREAPVAVVARAAMESALSAEAMDKLFGAAAKDGYTRDLLFSSVVNLMCLVVCRIRASVHAAYQKVRSALPVTVQALYQKLARIEPGVCSALVQHVAERLGAAIQEMGGALRPWLPGHPVRILDGAHLAATERRLAVLRGSVAGPLPGHCLVVLDPSRMLITDVIPCEDGHAQERSLTDKILALVRRAEVWLADRNFCTARILYGIVDRGGFPVIRQHATNVSWRPVGKRRGCGRIESGRVYEQEILVWDGDPLGRVLHFRRITLRLDNPTRDDEQEIHILTTLPERVASAKRIAKLYSKRWTLETGFQEIQKMLNGEIAALAYPRAALFSFSTALVAYNIVSTVKAALRAAHGHQLVQERVSDFYIAEDVRTDYRGLHLNLPAEQWQIFSVLPTDRLARFLVTVARNVDLETLRRHPRGPKKPVTPRTRYRRHTHVSVAKLLTQTTGRVTP
jgi:IS4 transposase